MRVEESKQQCSPKNGLGQIRTGDLRRLKPDKLDLSASFSNTKSDAI